MTINPVLRTLRDAINGLSLRSSLFWSVLSPIAVISMDSIFSAKGRLDAAFSCARRNRAAATIFIAFVICWMFPTLRMCR